MNEKFFPELTRRLRQAGIATGELDEDHLPVLLNGQKVMSVGPMGTLFLQAPMAHDPECERLYDRVAPISAQVHEYTAALASAPRLEADGLHEDFRLLAEFNGVVLGGRELGGGWGFEFATWWRTADRTGVCQGNYYDNYDGAKLDFACRSGLVDKDRLFSEEQLTEVYRAVHETLDSDPITAERENLLKGVGEQIKRAVPDLRERVYLSNQKELESADHSGPGLEMMT